jgi:peptidoglycan/LPS O-acetylase OafA/YrhL
MLLAAVLPRLGLGAAAASAVVWIGCGVVAEGALGPRLVPFARFVTSLPLTVLALALFVRLPHLAGVTAPLVWLGQSSYGIYLGQLLMHNAFVYGFGWPDLYQRLNLWLYTLVLLAGGLVFVWLGEMLLRLRPRTPAVGSAPAV